MILGLDEKVMDDKNFIKVIDGIAGSAKSSSLFRRYGVDGVGRYTSTNRLKRDAAARYGGHCDTIAGGLFQTSGRTFYAEQKDTEDDVVIIDEVLQSSPAVFQWALDHVGSQNIIMCTDSMQMMAPEAQKAMKKRFSEFCSIDCVMVGRPDDTLRPRDDETRAWYKALYSVVDKDDIFDLSRHDVVSLTDYDADAVYITHSNHAEEYLYNKFDLWQRYDLDLIPKGSISRKPPKDKESYPILPQRMKSGRNGYWQVANIATPTRYQGSECKGTCYWVMERGSRISNREYYTVVSRMYHIRDLTIVLIDPEFIDIPKTYNGKPVKRVRPMECSGSETIGRVTVSELCNGKDEVFLQPEDVRKITEQIPSSDDSIPDPYECFYKGVTICAKFARNTGKRSISSMLKREGRFGLDIMPYVKAVEGVTNGIHGPIIRNEGYKRSDYQYGLDLKAAYPHALCYGMLPQLGGQYDIGFWIVEENGRIPKGCIVTDVLSGCGQKMRKIFTVKGNIGSKMGERLHKTAHGKNPESIKGLHYGVMEQQMFTKAEFGDYGAQSYVYDPDRKYCLLMAAVKSEVCFRMLQAAKVSDGFINVDCLYFNGDPVDVGNRVKDLIAPYDFRVFRVSDGEILFKTY